MLEPLISKPITEMFMDEMKPEYVNRVLYYLRHELNCVVEPLKDKPGYHVTFPAGTVENTYPGRSTQWTHETILHFSTGQTITKYIMTHLSDMRRSTTTFGVPNEVLDGPEPPEA